MTNYDGIFPSIEVRDSVIDVVFRDSPFGMAFSNTDGLLIKVNEAFCTLTGYSSRELEGVKTFMSITHPDDAADLAMSRDLILGKMDHYQMQKRYITKIGNIIWIDLTASRILNKNGTIFFLFGVVSVIPEVEKYTLKTLSDSIWINRKYILACMVACTVSLGGMTRSYYLAIANNEVQNKRIIELLEERKQLLKKG